MALFDGLVERNWVEEVEKIWELKEGGGMSPGICKSWYFGGVASHKLRTLTARRSDEPPLDQTTCNCAYPPPVELCSGTAISSMNC